MGLLDYFNRGTNALTGSTGSYGGLLSDEERKAADQQAQLMMAASLLDAGGRSTERVGLGQALGRGMAAAQQGRQGAVDQSLQAKLLQKQLQSASAQQNPYGAIDPAKFTTDSMRKFNQSGDYADLELRPPTPASSSSIAEFEFYNKLPSEDDKKTFMALQRTPVLPQVGTVNGVTGLIDRTATNADQAFMPLTTQDAEIAAIIRKALEESRAKAKGGAIGDAEGGIEKKAYSARNVIEKLDLADPLIDAATGSLAGAGVDKLAAAFGGSPSGDQAIAQLKVLQADLMTSMPRMEGPQSDRDVELYREAAGQLGDPTVPRGRKKAAVQMIRSLQQKYEEAGTAQAAGAPMPKPRAAKRPPLSSFQKK